MIPIEIFMNEKYDASKLAKLKLVPFKSGGFCSEGTIKKLLDADQIKNKKGIVSPEDLIEYLENNFDDVRISRIYS